MIRKTKRKNKLINKYSKKNIKSKKTINNIGGAIILSEKEKEALKGLVKLYNTNNLCEILENYYHKPLFKVAKEIGICTTALKNICRNCGISRWPFRSIRAGKANKEQNQLLLDSNERIKNLIEQLESQESNNQRIKQLGMKK